MDQARANASLLAKNKMVLEFGTSGTAVCAATFATNPIDVVKVRVQLANSTGVTPGLVGTASSILRNEGMPYSLVPKILLASMDRRPLVSMSISYLSWAAALCLYRFTELNVAQLVAFQ